MVKTFHLLRVNYSTKPDIILTLLSHDLLLNDKIWKINIFISVKIEIQYGTSELYVIMGNGI